VHKLYTPVLLQEAFGDMNILLLEEYDAELSEGERHNGMSAIIVGKELFAGEVLEVRIVRARRWLSASRRWNCR
jgi:hypothetical protein